MSQSSRFKFGFPLIVCVLATSSVVGIARSRAVCLEEGTNVLAAWAAGPFETKVAFDRPVGPALVKAAVGRTIAFDEAPPIETNPTARKPGMEGRGRLTIAAAKLDDGGRTLVLTTDPHPRAGTYSLELPESKIAYDLSGVEVTWDDGGDDAPALGKAWWPTLDPSDTRDWATRSAAFQASLARLERPGRLTLTTLVTLPRGPVILRVAGNVAVAPTLNGEEPAAHEPDKPAVFQTESTGEPTLLTLVVRTGSRTGSGPPAWRVTAQKGGDVESEQRVGRESLRLPWAPSPPPAPAKLENVPELSGGDPKRGAEVFASAGAKCANCHKARGKGGEVGPDLSSLVGHDRLEVYRDVVEPSARLHPDYVPYTVALKDGRVLVGTVRAEGADAVKLNDTEAKSVVVKRSEVEEFRPSATSIMPVGLAGVIGEAGLRDLIAYLTVKPD